jgi:hypothetical protein
MTFPDARDFVFFQKGICLLVAFLFGLNSILELFWSNSAPRVGRQAIDPLDGLHGYATLGAELLIALAALLLFRWLHQRVRHVTANDAGLQLLTESIKNVECITVTWVQVSSVRKTLPNLLSGFYLIRLVDSKEYYTPIEREPPSFSTLTKWWSDAPAPLEQLAKKHGVWVD